jgi:hypothetical protein
LTVVKFARPPANILGGKARGGVRVMTTRYGKTLRAEVHALRAIGGPVRTVWQIDRKPMCRAGPNAAA